MHRILCLSVAPTETPIFWVVVGKPAAGCPCLLLALARIHSYDELLRRREIRRKELLPIEPKHPIMTSAPGIVFVDFGERKS